MLCFATIYLESVWGWYYNKNVYDWEGTSDGACRKDQAVKHDVEHHGKRDMMQFYWLLLVNNRIIKQKEPFFFGHVTVASSLSSCGA